MFPTRAGGADVLLAAHVFLSVHSPRRIRIVAREGYFENNIEPALEFGRPPSK